MANASADKGLAIMRVFLYKNIYFYEEVLIFLSRRIISLQRCIQEEWALRGK